MTKLRTARSAANENGHRVICPAAVCIFHSARARHHRTRASRCRSCRGSGCSASPQDVLRAAGVRGNWGTPRSDRPSSGGPAQHRRDVARRSSGVAASRRSAGMPRAPGAAVRVLRAPPAEGRLAGSDTNRRGAAGRSSLPASEPTASQPWRSFGRADDVSQVIAGNGWRARTAGGAAVRATNICRLTGCAVRWVTRIGVSRTLGKAVRLLRARRLRERAMGEAQRAIQRFRRSASPRAISTSHASGLAALALKSLAERQAWSNVWTTTCSAAPGSISMAYTRAYTDKRWRSANSWPAPRSPAAIRSTRRPSGMSGWVIRVSLTRVSARSVSALHVTLRLRGLHTEERCPLAWVTGSLWNGLAASEDDDEEGTKARRVAPAGVNRSTGA